MTSQLLRFALGFGLFSAAAEAQVEFEVFGAKHKFLMQGTSAPSFPGTADTRYVGYPSSTITSAGQGLYARIPADRQWGWENGTMETPAIPVPLPNFPVVFDPWRPAQDRTPIVGLIRNMRSPILLFTVPAGTGQFRVDVDLELVDPLSGIPRKPTSAGVTSNWWAGVVCYGTNPSNYSNRSFEEMNAPTVRLTAPNAANNGYSISWYTFASFAESAPYNSTLGTLPPGGLQATLGNGWGGPPMFCWDTITSSTTFTVGSRGWESTVYPDFKFKKSYTLTAPASWNGAATQMGLEFTPYSFRNWEDKQPAGAKADVAYFARTRGTVKIYPLVSLAGSISPGTKVMQGFRGQIPMNFTVTK